MSSPPPGRATLRFETSLRSLDSISPLVGVCTRCFQPLINRDSRQRVCVNAFPRPRRAHGGEQPYAGLSKRDTLDRGSGERGGRGPRGRKTVWPSEAFGRDRCVGFKGLRQKGLGVSVPAPGSSAPGKAASGRATRRPRPCPLPPDRSPAARKRRENAAASGTDSCRAPRRGLERPRLASYP